MKKHILVLLVFLASCSQDDTVPEELYNPDEAYARERYEAILELTGCKVEDAETVEKLFVYDDSSDGKYLYGSKKKEKRELFWISKYDDRGNSLWDIVLPTPEIALDKNEIESWAYSLKELSNGNLVFFQIMGANIMAYESRVLIINPYDGGTIANIDIEHSLFTNIHLLKEGFLVYSEERERALSPNASDKIYYISNDGELIPTGKDIQLVPALEDILLTDFLFIVNNPNSLLLQNIYGELIWKTDSEKWNYSIKGNDLTINYNNATIQDYVIIDMKSFEVIIDTGVLPIPESSLSFMEIGKQYKLSNGLSIVLNSVESSNNEGGTLYYDVDYTLINETEKDIINEGRFALLYKDKRGAIYQNGIFGSLYPGESVNRFYQFKVLEVEPVNIITYEGLTSIIDPLYWRIPD